MIFLKFHFILVILYIIFWACYAYNDVLKLREKLSVDHKVIPFSLKPYFYRNQLVSGFTSYMSLWYFPELIVIIVLIAKLIDIWNSVTTTAE